MRVIAPELVASMALLIIGGIGLLLYALIGRYIESRPRRESLITHWTKRAAERAEFRAKARARWVHFTEVDPQTGDCLIGIRKSWAWRAPGGRISQDDTVIMRRVAAGDVATRLNAEGDAIVRAQECNSNQN